MVTGALKTLLAADVILAALCGELMSVRSQVRLRAPDRFDRATTKGEWKAACVFVVTRGPLTIVENLSGFLGAITKSQWSRLAAAGDFTYLEYNDAIPYAQFVAASRGKVGDYYLFDGAKREVSGRKFKNWVAVASLVDDDEDLFLEESEGMLCLLGKRAAKKKAVKKKAVKKPAQQKAAKKRRPGR